MSDRISKCCGWGVHLGGITPNDPLVQPTQFYACDQCMKACDVETIEQRDHRMRVEGGVMVLANSHRLDHGTAPDETETNLMLDYATRIVAEHKEGKR